MARGITEDLGALPAVELITTRHAQLAPFHGPSCQVIEVGSADHEHEIFARLAQKSGWTVLIAPETSGVLLQRAERVEAVGGRLLSPGSDFIKIAANKQATAERLMQNRVPVPRASVLAYPRYPLPQVMYPAVIKPIDGCGSQGVRFVQNESELESSDAAWPARLEEYVPGLPVSVSILCGPRNRFALPACEQLLSADGSFTYQGGRLPLSSDVNRRARQLALQAVESLPATIGYVGVDMVLGSASDGSGDRVIEINPRLTTSYVGLRALAQTNLAAAMLAVALGQSPNLWFQDRSIEFTASGEILVDK
jgi:predicted ATP-grasp superfamily ATP-dependent carboligase